MSYIENNLNKGEKLKYHSKMSKKPILFWYLVLLVYPLLVSIEWILPFSTLYLPFALFAYFWSDFGVTGKRVIRRKGIISRNVSEMNLSSIESINVVQGIIGRILNYGSLEISGRGTTTVYFSNIDDPAKVRKLIQNKS